MRLTKLSFIVLVSLLTHMFCYGAYRAIPEYPLMPSKKIPPKKFKIPAYPLIGPAKVIGDKYYLHVFASLIKYSHSLLPLPVPGTQFEVKTSDCVRIAASKVSDHYNNHSTEKYDGKSLKVMISTNPGTPCGYDKNPMGHTLTVHFDNPYGSYKDCHIIFLPHHNFNTSGNCPVLRTMYGHKLSLRGKVEYVSYVYVLDHPFVE